MKIGYLFEIMDKKIKKWKLTFFRKLLQCEKIIKS